MDTDERERKLAEDLAAERGMTLEEAKAVGERAGLSVPVPMRNVCLGCGKERSIPSSASYTPCPCGANGTMTETLLGVVSP